MKKTILILGSLVTLAACTAQPTTVTNSNSSVPTDNGNTAMEQNNTNQNRSDTIVTDGKKEGEMCGGFAGFACVQGLFCQLEGNYPDAAGICVKQDPKNIQSFEDCANAGYPIMESYPRRCAVPGGKSFTENIPSGKLDPNTAKVAQINEACGDAINTVCANDLSCVYSTVSSLSTGTCAKLTNPTGAICTQVVSYATDPITGACWFFSTPCDVPQGWATCKPTPNQTSGNPPAYDTSCKADDDCRLIDRDLGYACCWAGRCVLSDYTDDNWIAINGSAYDRQQQANCPNEVDCGPAPLCPTIKPIGDYTAKCVKNLCTKVRS